MTNNDGNYWKEDNYVLKLFNYVQKYQYEVYVRKLI